ncbi:MAG TPA: hypothetical protein VF432_02125 [Thermoanaerobaculia bacterium]
MRTSLLWMFVCLAALAGGARHGIPVSMPAAPPALKKVELPPFDRVIRLDVEYDDAFAGQHGDRVEERIREAIAIHNVEWSRYRREWFELGRLTFRPSEPDRDASYVPAADVRDHAAAAPRRRRGAAADRGALLARQRRDPEP